MTIFHARLDSNSLEIKFDDDDGDDDDDDDDDELFLWPYFQLEPLSEILKIVNLRYAASRI